MVKTKITVEFESEKLKAARFYAGKKAAAVEDELIACLQKVYEKYVPAPTREYIESQTERETPPSPQRPERTGRPVAQPFRQEDAE